MNNVDRLAHKFETARLKVPGPVIVEAAKPEVGIIAYGTSHWAIEESLDQLRREHDIDAGYCRLRAYPFTQEVHDFINRYQRVYVVDQNRDAPDAGPAAAGIAAPRKSRNSAAFATMTAYPSTRAP